MITAEEARLLYERSFAHIEDLISKGIEKAANDGKTEIEVTIYDNEYDVNPIISAIEQAGYECYLTEKTIPINNPNATALGNSSSINNPTTNNPGYHYDDRSDGIIRRVLVIKWANVVVKNSSYRGTPQNNWRPNSNPHLPSPQPHNEALNDVYSPRNEYELIQS